MIEARRLNRSLRFWSAACSTGQEGYSIAMLLLENFPSINGWNIRIEGTDLSSEVVERAQEGCYHRIEMNRGLPARNVVKYFDHVGEDWVVKPEIRKLCNFRIANLCDQLPFHEKFDVIFLRNVMLYSRRKPAKPCSPMSIASSRPMAFFSSAPPSSPPTPPSGARSSPVAPATSAPSRRASHFRTDCIYSC